ncbi:MAG: sulfatase family protein [Actinomycetota bacterium]
MGQGARITGAVALAVILVSASCDPSSPEGSCGTGGSCAEPPQPNILVVMTDDQRADGTMGVMPATRALMARGGTVFTSAFATTPFCCPSRASVFTGRYAHNHRVLVNVEGHPDLLDQRSTVQHYLQQAGYRTGIFGKYLNGWDLERDPPYFDDWAIFDASETGYSGGMWNVAGSTRRVQGYSTTYIQRKAVDFIRSSEGSRPWLLFVSTAAPHEPYVPARRYEDADVPEWAINPAIEEADRSDKPPFLRARELRLEVSRRAHDQQLRTLMSVDDLVARIGDVLAATDQDTTLVFFLSDNGYLWGEHGVGKKMLPYTPSIAIPLMLRWPGRVHAGARDDRLAATIDVAPTILDAAMIEANPEVPMDGRSLLEQWDRERLLVEFWAAFGRPTWAGTRTRSSLFVEYYKRDGETVTFQEYYDVEHDPWELENLLGDQVPQVDVDALSRQLARDRLCAGGTCP